MWETYMRVTLSLRMADGVSYIILNRSYMETQYTCFLTPARGDDVSYMFLRRKHVENVYYVLRQLSAG